MAQVNFMVDDTIKAKAESACSAMGLMNPPRLSCAYAPL